MSSTLAALGIVLMTASVRAEAPALTAGGHFERGYAFAREGDFDAAITEFEAAYAVSPNFSVLFNLGQAYGAAGRAVEAASCLERYLELGGAEISAEQRQKVALLASHYRRRIGWLELHVEPAGAAAILDGKQIGLAPFAQPVEVSAGLHGLSLQVAGHESVNVSVRINGGQTSSSEARLVPREDTLLRLECPLRDVQVKVDGRQVGVTPLLEALQLPSGAHELTLTRAGYRASSIQLVLTKDKPLTIRCQLSRDSAAPGAAALRIQHPKGTFVTADEQPFLGERLPAGQHTIVVDGPGYEPVQRAIRLLPGTTTRLSIVPPRAGTVLERERITRSTLQTRAAYVTAGAAVLSGAAAAVLAITNRARYRDWRAKDDRFVAAFASDPSTTSPRQLDELLNEENSIRNRDSVALGLGVAAGILMAGSLALYVTAEDTRPALVVTGRGAALLTRW